MRAIGLEKLPKEFSEDVDHARAEVCRRLTEIGTALIGLPIWFGNVDAFAFTFSSDLCIKSGKMPVAFQMVNVLNANQCTEVAFKIFIGDAETYLFEVAIEKSSLLIRRGQIRITVEKSNMVLAEQIAKEVSYDTFCYAVTLMGYRPAVTEIDCMLDKVDALLSNFVDRSAGIPAYIGPQCDEDEIVISDLWWRDMKRRNLRPANVVPSNNTATVVPATATATNDAQTADQAATSTIPTIIPSDDWWTEMKKRNHQI